MGSAITGFYQQNSNGIQGSEIQLPSGISFGTTRLGGTDYVTFNANSQAKNEFKLFVTAGRTSWDSQGFGGKGQFDLQSNAMLVLNQGIAMGNTGNGTLTLDLWTANKDNSVKSFIFDLSGVSSSSYAFYGNLDITGSTDGSDENYSHKTLLGKFGGKGIKGNLTLSSKAKTNFIFGQDANIEGNVSVKNNPNATFSKTQGALTITGSITAKSDAQGTLVFEDSTTVQGKIVKPTDDIRVTGARTSIIFNGDENLIQGGVVIEQSTGRGQIFLDITFGESTINNTISGDISATGGRYSSDIQGTNKITFKGSGINKITGNIITNRDKWKANGRNDILFETGGIIEGSITATAGGNTITFSGGDSALISGNITGKYSMVTSMGGTGNNTIKMYASRNIISGEIKATNGSNDITLGGDIASITNNISTTNDGFTQFRTYNTITLEGGENSISNVTSQIATNTVTFKKGQTNSINGSITSNGGSNTIRFLVDGTNKITGNVSANSGVNVIRSAGSLTLGASSITAGSNGKQAKNLFDIAGKLDLSTSSVVIKAHNRDNTNSEKHNIFKIENGFEGNSATIAELSTISVGGYLDRTKNIISIESNAEQTLNITELNNKTTLGSSQTGYTYIGKGLTQGSDSSLTLNSNFNDSSWSNSIYTSNLVLTIASDMYANGGKNHINVKQLTASSITASGGGANNIAIGSSSSVSGDITTTSNGTNNFSLIGNGATLVLNGKATGGTTHQITTLSANGGNNILTLDNSKSTSGEMNTAISTLANGENLTVNFSGGGNAKTLKINASDKTNTSELDLKSITLTGASERNTLDLTDLSNVSILSAISVGSGQDLSITLKNTNLNTVGWSNIGASTINVGGTGIATANASLSGGAVSLSNLKFSATTNSTMTLKNTETTIATVTSTYAGDTLILDASSNAVNTTITNGISGTTLSATMKGNGTGYGATLTLGGNNNTLKTLVLENNSTNNTLALSSGKTTITDQVKVGESSKQELSFVLNNNTELALTGGLATTKQNGTSILKVKNATTQATLSGGTVGLTRLELMTEGNATSTLLFKNTTTTIDELFSSKGENVLKMAEGSQSVTINSSAKNTQFSLDFADSGNTQAKTFTLAGGENTIKTLSVSDNASNTLAITGGHTTILDAINIDAGKNLTLSLTSDASTASDSQLTLNSSLTTSATVNILFDGGVNPADQIHHSTLFLKGANNQINSVTSNATNAVIAFDGTAGATIKNVTINGTDASKNGSLVFGFIGAGDSTVQISNAVTVGNGATLGVSLGGSGEKRINGTINFQQGSTLLVDFLAGNTANATLGSNGAFTISTGSKSIINFHGANSGRLNGSGITINGGDNTINFIGSATMGGVTLASGTNTINVYGAETQSKAITGTVIVGQLANVSNTINLNDYSVLNLKNGESGANGSGNLTSNAHNNVLNFKGENAKLDGSFGSTGSNTATINVGESGKAVSGLITGNLNNASIVFKEGDSKLTLQGQSHTLSSVTTKATNGILVLDASKNDVTATVSNTSGMTIDTGKSITIALHSTSASNNNATFNVAQGDITVNGTLGIAISGDGTGQRNITANSGNITFNDNSTLRVDFLEGSRGTASLGSQNSKFEIGANKNSEINFYAGSTATLQGGGLKLTGGSNTVNFYGNATLGQVELVSGSNTVNVKEGIVATIENTASSLGSVNNTLNLDSNATLRLRATTGESSAIGSILSNSTNTLNFNGDNATLLGGFGSTSGSGATINVKGLNSLIVGNVSQAGVAFSKDNATLTLQGTDNTLSTLTSTTQGNKVILDASKNAVKATITSAVSGTGSVALRFGAGSGSKTFAFSETGNTLSGVEFDESGSTNNAVAFTKGTNTISNAFVISQGQGLSVTLGDSSQDYENGTKISLSTQGLSEDGGSASLKVLGNNTANALISGGDIAVSTLDMIANTSTSLTLKANTTIGTIGFGAGNQTNTITLDTTDNAVTTTISNGVDGEKLTVNLNGTSSAYTATLALNGASTINTLGLSGANNLLNVNADSNILSKVTVATSQGLGISVNNANLELNNGFENTGGNASFNLAGNATLSGAISTLTSGVATNINVLENARATLSGSVTANVGATDFTLKDNAILTLNQGVTTTGGTTTFNVAGDQTKVIGNISTTGGATNISFASGSDTTVLNLEDGIQTISGISLGTNENRNNVLNLSTATTTVTGELALGTSNTQDLTINLQNSSLTLADIDTKTNGALNVNSNDSSLKASSIKANGNGRNNIQVDTLTLNGNLEALTGAQNTIQANAITFSGAIKADSTTANSNQNTIIAQNITFSGSEITSGANNGGWFSQNIFEISGETNFTNSNLVIKANQKANTNTEKTNIFKFGGKVEGAITELVASTINEKHNRTKNILSFDGQEASTLTIGDINKDIPADAGRTSYASGVNYIGANLTSGSGSDLKLSFNENQWSSEQYRANLDLTVTNEIQAKRGNNYINVSSLKAQTLTNDYGTNYIAVSGDFIANKIVSTYGGRNEIIVGGNATITTLNIGNNGNGNTATNKITFAGNNSQNAFLGDILIANTQGTRKNELVLAGENATLTLKGKNTGGTTHAITSLDSTGANTSLILDNSGVESGNMATTIDSLSNGSNLTAKLNGQTSTGSVTLALKGENALKALTLGEGANSNILDLENSTSTQISDKVLVGADQSLNIKLGDTALALTNGMSGGNIELKDGATATLSGGSIDVAEIKLGSSANATLNIQGSTATINELVFQNGSTLGLSNAQTTINSAIDSTSTKLNIEMADSTLILGHSSNSLDNLTSTNGLVDLTQGKGVTKARSAVQTNTNARNTLTIGNFTGDATFKLFASSQNSDQVIFNNPAPAPYAAGVDATPTNTATIVVVGGSDIYNITYDPTKNDNIMVADVSGANGQVAIEGGKSMIGISEVQVQLTEGIDVSTGNGKYYIGSIKDLGLKQEYQEVVTSALTVNYDLYLANFNSLNKRMGELRDNPHSQGVWARVFGGAMSNDFGAGSKTDYITAQAGYDYALSVGENAKNYVGVAIAYGTSKTKGNTLDISAIGAPANSISLSNVDSNMVEVGIYNSYVMDSGWYNDTIFKFDYIMSEFSLSNDPNQMSNTNNFAMVLSNEFGYRYKFAESEKGNWYIDPQVEMAFGYFNQSDFNRAMYESGVFTGSTIQASQDSIITLRTKAGLSLGKKFITEKGFASLYVGAFYEYDYINGGDAETTGRTGGTITQLDKVESNGRAIVNIGSNIELTEGVRMYIDVEKSFGDKQRTFMQFNFGARYSF